ncbi:hypothetical protein [Oceanibaculum pacificum]|nr:hypothetical protein [Oceanibaculum pacificum]
MILDKILGLIALLFFVGFLGIIIFSVKQPALIIVAALGIAMVAYDFWLQLFKENKGRY